MGDPRKTLATRPRHARDHRIVEGYSTARMVGYCLWAVVIVAAIVVGTAVAAHAAGSDSPTPYTVDRTGIALPAGRTFQDNGHVNIRWTTGTGAVHFEGKCITRTDAECAGKRHDDAQYIGAAFIPWSAFGDPDCVTWVQISDFNEHYGEGGQPPVCLTTKEPTPCASSPTVTPSPSVTPSATPTSQPSSTTSPTAEPSTTPEATPTPSPSAPSPSPSMSSPPASPSPSVTSTPQPTHTPAVPATPSTPSSPAPSATSTPSHEPTRTPAVLATQPPSATPTGPGSQRPPVAPAVLAATGTDTTAALAVGIVVVVVGCVLYTAARRNR